jgi:hypothetical protein
VIGQRFHNLLDHRDIIIEPSVSRVFINSLHDINVTDALNDPTLAKAIRSKVRGHYTLEPVTIDILLEKLPMIESLHIPNVEP